LVTTSPLVTSYFLGRCCERKGSQGLLTVATAVAGTLHDAGLPREGADRRFVMPEQLRNIHSAESKRGWSSWAIAPMYNLGGGLLYGC
jgi:hypothetical protein